MAGIGKRERIFNMLHGRCFYCGCELDFENFHLDHYNAKSKGGKSGDNLVPACPECNLCKSNLDIEGFREKVSKEIFDTFQGRMITKYHNVKPRKIKFYFEREDIQDGIV